MKSRLLPILVALYFLNNSLSQAIQYQEKHYTIAVLGTGYVGLVLGAGLADFGHTVYCADINSEKINQLKQGIIPIFEPGLSELIQKDIKQNRLFFTDNIIEAIQKSDIVFIAIGTPSLSDGSADISAVKIAAQTIGLNLNGNKFVCIKSTLPIGASNLIKKIIQENNSTSFAVEVISNPEFLREGCAVHDFFNPDRIVIGSESLTGREAMLNLYAPLIKKNIPFLTTDLVSAETIKYASNTFLTIKVSYINEIAQLCDKTGANINAVTYGMGLDERIGNKFLMPGPGYGGSCFPKDILAFVKTADQLGMKLRIASACIEANEYQKMYIVQKISELLGGNLEGKTIAIWGLAFKANTDDVRKSPAIDIINALLGKGSFIKAYDPAAMNNMKQIIPQIYYCATKEEALEHSDALIILTEWAEFKNFDYSQLCRYANCPIIVDMRDVVAMDITKNIKNYVLYKLGKPNANKGTF